MTITVTQEHINKGKRGANCQFPVALAVNDLMRPTELVWVGYSKVKCGGREFKLPQDAIAFIRDFDDYRQVDPFSFELDIP